MVHFHLSLSGCGTGSLETCTHIIPMPESYTIIIIIFGKGLGTAHQSTHDNVSICLCLGATRGAWEPAPM